MKKAIYLFVIIITSFNSLAQTAEEALLFSDQAYIGTARSHAMGNAFGSLGADITSLHINPGALGVYRTLNMSFTMGLGMREVTAYHQGNQSDDLAGNFNVTSFGFVSPLKRNPSSDWRRVNFSFSYNKNNIFKSSMDVRGFNENTSLVDVFHDYAQGKFYNAYSPEGMIYENDYLNPFYENGAFWVDLIDLDADESGNWLDNGEFFREVMAGQDQRKITNTSGYMGEYQFSYAGSYQENLYVGASLGISSLDYVKETYYTESNFTDTSSTVKGFYMLDDLYTKGLGINLKIGGIYRLNDKFRLGLSWHSPTFYNMQDQWQMQMSAQHELNDSSYSFSYTSPYGLYDYELVTPVKIITSASYIIDKKLVLSGDLEFIDYSSMRLDGEDYNYFDQENQKISNVYSNTYNTRLGLELNLSPIVLRAGYAKYGNPLVNENDDAQILLISENTNQEIYRNERQTWSVGLGKRNKYSYIDFAYSYSEQSLTSWMYNPNYIAPSKLINSYNNILVTLGWKF